MAKNKKSPNVNVTVFEILQAITGELPCYASPTGKESAKKTDLPENNPAAVALGRARWSKDGNAGAVKLSSKNRKDVAGNQQLPAGKKGR